MVNGEAIGHFKAQRRPDDNGADPDALNTYDICIDDYGVYEDDGTVTRPSSRSTFSIEHHYGDGAWELVRKAIGRR